MNATEKRALIPLLKRVLNDTITHGTKSTARYWLHRLQKPRSKPSAQRKEAKAAQHREETGRIREAVFRRAATLCEVTGCLERATDMDHWLGGWGRRRQKQSVETCWMLCVEHHRRRGEAIPDTAEWNRRFAAHCARYGYPFEPHIEHADLPRKAAP